MTDRRVRRTTPLLAVVAALTLAPSLAAQTAPAALSPVAQAMAQATAAYETARSHTTDLTRAYAYSQASIDLQAPRVYHRALYLIIGRDGGGMLSGSVANPVMLSADELRPFEAAIAASGFPHFAMANTRVICNDRLPDRFEAAARGLQVQVFSDECGKFSPRVERAVHELIKLADAHGGMTPPL